VLFCTKLVRDLVFEERALQPCCNTHNIAVPSFPFAGGAVDMAAYTRHIGAVAQEIQRQNPQICAGCPDLVPLSQSVHVPELQFSVISLNHHRHVCNCRCVYCDLWKPGHHPRPFAILPALRSLHDQGALKKNCAISWGGGESTLLPDFETTGRWLRAHGYFQQVHTNALRHSDWIDHLLSSGAGRVNISLDSGSAATYARVKGGDWWDKVLASTEKYFTAAITPRQVDLKYIVFEANNKLDELDRFFQVCQQVGAAKVQLSFNFIEVVNGKVSEHSIAAAAHFVHRAEELGLVCELFFVDAPLRERMDAARHELFG
jgi:molybdenum cofactor biosynthesis enzyme MoaA